MSQLVNIKLFNNLIDQFLDFLETDFKEFKSDIILAKNTISILRTSNPRIFINMFMSSIEPYKKYIIECDEDFFLKFEDNLDIEEDNIIPGCKIREIWKSADTTELQKAKIWNYLNKLIKIGEKV